MAVLEGQQLRQWAAKGAEQRLVEIAQEAAAIYRAFPELRQRRNGLGGFVTPERSSATPAGRRSRRRMSAAQRKAVSERMRRYWAERRGESTAGATQAKTGRRRRRKMSAEARKRIAEAQRKRWAEVKATRARVGQEASSAQSPVAGGSPKKK